MFVLHYQRSSDDIKQYLKYKGYNHPTFNVVSVCLFRTVDRKYSTLNKYLCGISNLICSFPDDFPSSEGWVLRIYCDQSLTVSGDEQFAWENVITNAGLRPYVQLVLCDYPVLKNKVYTNYHVGYIMSMARFLSMDDKDVNISVIRDVDTAIHNYDLRIINQFRHLADEQFGFIVSRDYNPQHLEGASKKTVMPHNILAGLIMSRWFGDIGMLLEDFIEENINKCNKVGVDEMFLNGVFKSYLINNNYSDAFGTPPNKTFIYYELTPKSKLLNAINDLDSLYKRVFIETFVYKIFNDGKRYITDPSLKLLCAHLSKREYRGIIDIFKNEATLNSFIKEIPGIKDTTFITSCIYKFIRRAINNGDVGITFTVPTLEEITIPYRLANVKLNRGY
jgi:hypothetical protein